MTWLSTAIAIYGAIVSGAVALIQIRKFLSERNILNIKIERAFGEAGETIDFRISNVGSSMTRIDDIAFFSHELTREGIIVAMNGNDAALYDRSMWSEKDERIELPRNLDPGQMIYARLAPLEYKSLLENKIHTAAKYLNLFSIEIDHSRSDKRLGRFFIISDDGPFCKPTGLPKPSNTDLIRSRIWAVDQGIS